jgi:hypothetical protein
MQKIKRKLLVFIVGIVVIIGLIGVAYAGFSDKGKVLGSSFSIGNADIKLLANITQGTETGNLVDEMPGPSFTNIGQSWQKDYLIKLYNNGTYKMAIVSHSNYETANDPDDLRQYISAEIFPWDDVNNDGLVTEDEIGTSFGKKTIIKWKTEGFSLGEFDPGEVLGFIVRFSTETLSDTKQGKQGMFDFEFDSIEL